MKKMLLFFAALVSFACVAAPTNAVPVVANNDAHIQQIRAVVEAFRTSLINKDKETFLKLFLNDNVPWIGVTDGNDLVRIRKEQPGFKGQRASTGGNHVKFIEGIVASPIAQEEKFWNIRIDTDGNISTVNFDYSFHAGITKTNWGKEAWQLVNTDAGWKINSVIYSIIVNPPPPKKEIAVVPARLMDYIGTYEVKAGINMLITVEGNRLMVKMGKTEFPVFAEADDKFFEKTWGATMEFIRDAGGKVTRVIMAEGEEASTWIRR